MMLSQRPVAERAGRPPLGLPPLVSPLPRLKQWDPGPNQDECGARFSLFL